jgi:hypothetical protein
LLAALVVVIFVAVVVELGVCLQALGYLRLVEITQLLLVLVVDQLQMEQHQVLLVQ